MFRIRINIFNQSLQLVNDGVEWVDDVMEPDTEQKATGRFKRDY